MRKALILFLATAACACKASHGGEDDGQAALAQCAANQTVLYSKVTPPSAGEDGASGIGDAPAVLTGSSGSGSSGGEGEETPTVGGTASSSTSPAQTVFASTTASCMPAVCPAGLVAVPILQATSGSGSSEGSDEGDGAAVDPPASGISDPSTGAPLDPSPSTPTTSPPTSTSTSTSTYTAANVTCTEPPPGCDDGQAPSWAPAGHWHCMPLCDANNPNLVVISYGGIYGNGGICAGPPPANACPASGQVWTWDFYNEDWACEAECDNGEYDQHVFAGQTVCVPC